MKKKEAVDLRQKAEELLSKKTSTTGAQISENEMQKLVHELEVHQIELELQNEELLLARAEEKEISEKYVNLYDFAPSGYFTLSSEGGSIIELNLAGASLLGKERSYLKNKPFALFIAEASKPTFSQFFEDVLKSSKTQACDAALSVSNESALYIHMTGIAADNKEQILLTVIDITKKKKAEEAIIKIKNELKSALESMSDAVFISDVHGNFVEYNEAFAIFHKLKDKEACYKALKDWQNIIEVYNLDGSLLPHDKWVVNRAINGETVSGEEYILENKDTGERWYGNYNYAPIRDDKGMIIGSVVVARDVTERVQSEKDLQESEEKYRSLVEGSLQGMVVALNDPLRIAYASSPMETITGYSPGEIESFGPEELTGLVHPDDRGPFFKAFAERLSGKDFESGGSYRLIHKDGSVRWVDLYSTLIQYKNEPATQTAFLDVTERKKAEAELKGIEWLLQPKEKTTLPDSPEYGDLTALNTERTILDAVGKEVLNGIVSDYLALLETSAAVYEKNGDYAFGIFSSDWCQFMDCASRALCKSKDNKKALESGEWLCHESCWKDAALTSMQTNQPTDIECSGGLRMYAVPITANNEIVGSINFGYGTPPKDENKLKEIAANYKVSVDKLREIAQNYETRPAFIISIAKEKLESSARLIGNMVERKFAEDKLHQSEKRLKTILDSSPFPTAVVDNNDESIKYWSHSAIKLFGYKPKTTQEWYESAYPDTEYRKEVVARWLPFLKIAQDSAEAVNTGEYQIVCKDGSVKTCEIFAQFIPDNLIITLNDITSKKASEKAVKESEEKYRHLLELSNDLIWATDPKGVILEMNQQSINIYGYKPEELIGKNFLDFVPADQRPSDSEAIEKNAPVKDYISVFTHKDGHRVYLKANSSVLKNKNGEVEKVIGTSKDITQEVIDRNKLIESNKRFEKAQKMGRIGNFEYDIATEIYWASDEAKRIYGYSLEIEDFSAEDVWKFIPDNKRVQQAWVDLIEKDKPYNLEYEIRPVSGPSSKMIKAIAEVVRDKSGNPIKVVGLIQDITELKKAEDALKESKTILDATEKMAKVGGWKFDLKSKEVSWTDETYRIHEAPFDYNPSLEEAINFFHPDERAKLSKAIDEAINGSHYDLELRLITTKGNERWARTKCIPKLKNGKVVELLGTIQDITEKKMDEEEHRKIDQRFRIAMEMLPDGFTILKPVRDSQNQVIDFTWEYENDAVAKMNGTDPQKIVGQRLLELFPGHEGTQFFEIYKEVVETGKTKTFEEGYQGETIKEKAWFRIVVVPMNGNIAILNQDITSRKIADKELKESEIKYRNVFNNSALGIFKSTPEGKYELVNKAFANMLGFESTEKLLKEVSNISALYKDPEDREIIKKEFADKGFVEDYEILANHPDKNTVWISINARQQKHPDGSVYYEGTIQDITEKKKAQEALKESREEISRILKNSMDAILLTSPDGSIYSANPAACKMFGRSEKEICEIGRKGLVELGDPTLENFIKVRDKQGKAKGEVNLLREDGTSFPAEMSSSLFKDKDGNLKSSMIIRDISDRKQAETALLESELRFKTLHNATFGGIAIHNNGILRDCNHGLSQTTGYSENELIGMEVLRLFAEESREMVKAHILAEYEETYEALGMRKSGEKYPVRIAAKMIPYKGEKVRIAEFRDITDQKRAIEKLKKSEELHRLLTENSVDMIWQMDLRLNFTYISPNCIDVLGYTQMELMGTNLSGYATRKEFFKMARQALNSLKNYKTFRHVIFEANLIKKNGEEIPVEIIGRILLNKSGLPVALQGSTRDITERKQIQDELQINFERYQKAQSIGHVGNWEYNIATNEIWASDEAKRIYGFDVNRKLIDLEEVEKCIPKRKEVNQALVNLIEHNKEYDLEFEIITADKGLSKYIRSTAVVEKDKNGSSLGVLGIIHDITERKNAEKELNKIHNRFNLAINATNDGLFDWNLVTNEIYYSPAWKLMLGYRDDELPNDFSIWENLTEPEDAKRSWKMQQELINKQRDRFEMEFKMKHKDGHWVDILSRATAYFDENDKAIRIVGTHVDISERKKAAEEIYRLKKAVDDSFFGVVMATLDGTNIYSNHAAYKLFGYDPTKDNMDGTPSGIGWADQEKFKEAMQQLKSNGSGEADFIGIRKDGSHFDCYVSATLITNLSGEQKLIIAYYMDVTEKKKSEKYIKELNEQLEQKVLVRTKELEDRNEQLARMNKLFVGRELRMKELKQMIKQLEEKLEDK